jgi:alanine racemase
MTNTWIEINKKALLNNYKILRKSASCELAPIIKANAYGHGLLEVGHILAAKTTWLGVNSLDEALKIRKFFTKNIIILSPIDKKYFNEIKNKNLNVIVGNIDYLKTLLKACVPSKNIHLKIDTGMSRQGVLIQDFKNIIQLLRKYNIRTLGGIMTHFSGADEKIFKKFTANQDARLSEAVKYFKSQNIDFRFKHAQNTAGVLSHPNKGFYNLARSGIGIYGLTPSAEYEQSIKRLGFQPVLSLKTKVFQLKNIEAGSYVGYGLIFRAKNKIRIAVIPIGYYDGLPRTYLNGFVLIGGKKCKILGRVSMNMTVVDVSSVKNIKIGDIATIIGVDKSQSISVEEVAQKCGTINYEIVTRLNSTLPKLIK